ncbi:sulfotransferase [Actibacterium sp. MT2.3-13A]|uniref:sulfotransferase family protein n=1 Tax=Actibacterium sp. MT2.3-13A TaxID=2828332 RepID=UPI001BA66E25|nr:sulfotransferase [Actibacterium sp. MT2.3-13A]
MTGQTPPLHAPGDGHVFIVTYGRSGSTLLQNLLNSIPGYCIRGENNNTLYHMARAWEAVSASEEMRGQRRSGQPTTREHPWYGAELVDPDVLGRDLAETFRRDVLRSPPGTRVAGFKEIRFHLAGAHTGAYLDFIERFFPGSRFVFNTRDHAAVARSGWWASMEPAAVKRELETAEKVFARMRDRLGDRALALHYDDYVGRPQALKPLFDFLDEPFDAARVAQVIQRRLTHSGTD